MTSSPGPSTLMQTENIAACAPGKKTTRLASTGRPAQADARFAIS